MRRQLLSLGFAVMALFAVLGAGRAQTEGAVAQALVGRWEWESALNGATVFNQLTLTGSGTFAYTTMMQTYQVNSFGQWAYRDGWLMFRATSSRPLDVTGEPIGMAPILVLEVGTDFVRTPAGIARRTL